MGTFTSLIVHIIAPHMPSKICSKIYGLAGLANSEYVRNKTYIQNIKALHIGKNTFINRFCKMINGFDTENEDSHITIGNNVTIGYGTTIITSTHKIGNSNYRADFRSIAYKPVEIGDGTWICANCTILPGVHVGRGCVIAAGSVIVNDCKDNCVYGGNPAKMLKGLNTLEEKSK